MVVFQNSFINECEEFPGEFNFSQKLCNYIPSFFFITEKLELIEAGKAGPVGSPKEDTPSPKPHPIREQKSGFLATDVNILENGMGLEPELPEINFQV